MRHRPLGPRRLAGTNPRTAGTDLRTRLASPRALGTNPRALTAAQSGHKAHTVHPEPTRRRRPLLPVQPGCYYDSGWRRAALRQREIDPATGFSLQELADGAQAPGLTLAELFTIHTTHLEPPP